MEALFALLAGAGGAAVIKLFESIVLWILNRRAKLTDEQREEAETDDQRRDNQIKVIGEQLEALAAGHKVSMRDRITYLGRRYIKDGSVSFEDRDTLIEMHAAYHALGGNGHMDAIMAKVMKLPLKK